MLLGIVVLIAFAPYIIAIGLVVFVFIGMIGVIADAVTGAGSSNQ